MEKKDIQKYIDEFRKNLMPADFKWRAGQKEAIEGIVDAYFSEKYQTVILDAPVGSGKSIIAMCASWILNRFKKNGYILASDLSLQEQYEKDLNRLDFAWGSIKGLDNYNCIDNMEKVSMGTCKMRRVDPKKMNCYGECPYYQARTKASRSSTSILNYNYWLIMQNEVNSVVDEDKQIFPQRDFTICDEAHKILDIIQGNYSPKLSENP